MKIQPTWDEHCIVTSSTSVAEDEATNDTSCKKRKNPVSGPSVRFAADTDNVVHEIMSVSDYTPEEVEACWFNKADYSSFKRIALVTMQLSRAGKLSSGDLEHTLRGLECRRREDSYNRKVLRFNACQAVLQEQHNQTTLGYQDDDAIAAIYRTQTWNCQQKANTVAKVDEQVAHNIHQEDDAAATTKASTTSSPKRSNALSRIISIDRNDDDVSESTITTSSIFPSFLAYQQHQQSSSTSSLFNLNSFLDGLSTVAVGAV